MAGYKIDYLALAAAKSFLSWAFNLALVALSLPWAASAKSLRTADAVLGLGEALVSAFGAGAFLGVSFLASSFLGAAFFLGVSFF